jgi:hypothetical protein
MKTKISKFSLIFVIFFITKAVNAFNPIELTLLFMPPSPTTVSVTVDLGHTSCAALGCHWYYCQIYYVLGGSYYATGTPWQYQNGGPTYHTWSSLTVDDHSSQICAYWYYIWDPNYPSCDEPTPTKLCCISYQSGTSVYSIPCNPCDQ